LGKVPSKKRIWIYPAIMGNNNLGF
jgi:hypothetical protein